MHRYLNVVISSFILTFIVFVLGGALIAPANLSNLGAWDYWLVLPLGLTLSIAGAFVLTVIVLVLPTRFEKKCILLLRALALVGFVVTVFFPKGVTKLDGSSALTPSMFKTTMLIWAGYGIVVALLIWMSSRYETAFKRLFNTVALVSVLVVAFVVGLFQFSKTGEIKRISKNEAPLAQLYEFGSRSNVVVILMDMLQGSFVEQTLSRDPRLRKTYNDFTIYTRAISSFPFTSYSLPTILSGMAYALPDNPSFFVNLPAAITNSFITDAEHAGYQTIGVQSSPYMPVALKNIPAFEISADSELSSLSYSDYFLKRYSIEIAYGSALRLLKVDLREKWGLKGELEDLKESSRNLLVHWTTNSRIGKDRKKLFFVHNFLTHSPIVYDRTGQRYVDIQKYPWTHDNLLEEIGYSLDLLNNVFDRMKSLGIYDDALIIIIGDHGHFMGYHTPDVYAGVEDFQGHKSGVNFRPVTMYNPAMLIKPPRSHSGSISHDAIGLIDVRAIVNAYLQTGEVKLDKILADQRRTQPSIPVMTCLKESNAYFSTDCHQLIYVQGNVSALPALFEQLDAKV